MSQEELRLIVLMQARARLRLRNVDGLWRKPVLGRRCAVPRPGSITEFIRAERLLPLAEVEYIEATAPNELIEFQAAWAALPIESRTPMRPWLERFQEAAEAISRRDAERKWRQQAT